MRYRRIHGYYSDIMKSCEILIDWQLTVDSYDLFVKDEMQKFWV